MWNLNSYLASFGNTSLHESICELHNYISQTHEYRGSSVSNLGRQAYMGLCQFSIYCGLLVVASVQIN